VTCIYVIVYVAIYVIIVNVVVNVVVCVLDMFLILTEMSHFDLCVQLTST